MLYNSFNHLAFFCITKEFSKCGIRLGDPFLLNTQFESSSDDKRWAIKIVHQKQFRMKNFKNPVGYVIPMVVILQSLS